MNDAVLSAALALCLGGGAIDLVALNLVALPEARAPLPSEHERSRRVQTPAADARRAAHPPSVSVAVDGAAHSEPQPIAILEFEVSSRRVNRHESHALREAAAQLRAVPEITVIGHADASGSEELNDRLSAQRAAAVLQYLIASGIPKARMRLAARGEREPRKDGNSRRVEIYVGGRL